METKNKFPLGKKRFVLKFKLNIWTILLGVFLVIFLLPLFFSFADMQGEDSRVDISQALVDIKEEKVEKVSVENEKVTLNYKDGSIKTTTKEPSESFADLLEKEGISPSKINYTVVDQSLSKVIGDILSVVLPLGLMAAFFFFILRAQSRGAQDIFSFGRSRARLFAKGKQSVTFNDVAGVEEAKKELEEVVDFLKNPAKYRKIGARTPKGVLLLGQAGVGKTLLARAVAGEPESRFSLWRGRNLWRCWLG